MRVTLRSAPGYHKNVLSGMSSRERQSGPTATTLTEERQMPKEPITNERGFTFVELLVTMLMIGILAAIAIPAFLNQAGKAVDAGAKSLANSAQTAAESYAVDNRGYSSLTPTILGRYEPTIPTTAGSGSAYVSALTATATTYSITTSTPSSGGETFTVARNTNGSFVRSCTPATGAHGGCVNGSW
jgi:type IV pilus assembly protein PilA